MKRGEFEIGKRRSLEIAYNYQRRFVVDLGASSKAVKEGC
jgi:hypothetical protein